MTLLLLQSPHLRPGHQRQVERGQAGGGRGWEGGAVQRGAGGAGQGGGPGGSGVSILPAEPGPGVAELPQLPADPAAVMLQSYKDNHFI